MNRNDFRSAYDKIVLPEDVRAEMKKKLLEQVSERDSASGGAENGGSGQAREIRLQPRKRSAGRIVAVAGSAAAVVIAVGAGIWFSRGNIVEQPGTTISSTTETQETTEESTAAENNTTAANGELFWHDAGITSADYTAPDAECNGITANYILRSHYIYAVIPGESDYSRQLYRELAAEYGDEEYARSKILEMPMADTLQMESAYESNTGLALSLTGSGMKLTISVSTREDEFLPLVNDKGEYLEWTGEYDSWATVHGGYDFIGSEKIKMGVCGRGGRFLAQYSLVNEGVTEYFRLYSDGLTREQFVQCLAAVSPLEPGDHMGNYSPDGSYDGNYINATEYEKDGSTMPGSYVQATEWGDLTLNQLTWTASELNASCYNVQAFVDQTDIDEGKYSFDELSQLTGIGVLSDPESLLGQANGLGYCAAYDGISSGKFDSDHGVTPGMLPEDDPAQYAEAQQYLSLSEDESEYYYTTDRTDYFKDKKRTGVRYSISGGTPYVWTRITVTDDMRMLDDFNYIFGRLPAEPSEKFSSAGKTVYAGHGQICGRDIYMGGFQSGDSYVVVTASNTGLREFARILAALCEDNVSPEPLKTAEYPEPSYTLSGNLTGTYSTGYFFLNALRMSEPPEDSGDTKGYSERAEILSDYAKLAEQVHLHSDLELLTEKGWTLDTGGSVKMDFSSDGEPQSVSIDYTFGISSRLIVTVGSNYAYDPIRVRLPSGKVMYASGSGCESGLNSYEKTILGEDAQDYFQMAICGRLESGVPYYIVDLYYSDGNGRNTPALRIECENVTEEEVMDILAVLVYGIDKMP